MIGLVDVAKDSGLQFRDGPEHPTLSAIGSLDVHHDSFAHPADSHACRESAKGLVR
jgi:hypothetical protein